MSKITAREIQTIKFIKWIDKYPGWWHLICTPNDEHINLSMMQLLIEQLAKESLYEIIFVLLKVHRNEKFMRGLSESMIQKVLISGLNIESKEEMLKELIDYFE